MKYFGSYTNSADLVPKSYIDNLLFMLSHDEYSINVADRVILYKNEKGEYYGWDNYKNSTDVPSGSTDYVTISLDTSIRSTSIEFRYDRISSDPYFPQYPSNVDMSSGSSIPPYNNTIYYVLDFSNHLDIGKELFVYFRTQTSTFNLSSHKIRVLIPNEISLGNDTRYVSFNGKFLTNDSLAITTRNGYVDLGFETDQSGTPIYRTGTLHIYTDENYYFIDRYQTNDSNLNSSHN